MQAKPKLFLRGLAAVLLVVLGYVAAQLLAVEVFALLLPLIGTLAANAVYAVVAVALFTGAVVLAARVEKRRPGAYGLRHVGGGWPQLVLGLALGVVAFLLVAGPLYLLGQYRLAAGSGGALALACGLLDYIVVGYMEELLCRGFLQHRFLRRLGPLPALAATALVFAALHLLNPSFSPLAFLNIFLAGTFMGAVMYATGSLWAAVGVHITWNWVQGSVLGIPVSGGARYGLFATEIVGQNGVVTGGEFGAEGSVVCTVVLLLGTALCLWLAKRSGRLAAFGPAPAGGAGRAANPAKVE